MQSQTPEPKPTSLEELTTALERAVQDTALSAEQGTWLRSRWFENVRILLRKESKTRTQFYALRGTAIASSLIVPALVSLNLQGDPAFWVKLITVLLSLIAAISSAAIDLLRFGPRWRIYRAFGENLQSQGWKFLELAAPYQDRTHEEAMPTFINNVEQALTEYNRDYEKEVMSLSAQDRSKVPTS